MRTSVPIPDVSLAEVVDAVARAIVDAWSEGHSVELLFVAPTVYERIVAARVRECTDTGGPPRLFGLIVSPQSGLDPSHPIVR
jgi:hypothetical protein